MSKSIELKRSKIKKKPNYMQWSNTHLGAVLERRKEGEHAIMDFTGSSTCM